MHDRASNGATGGGLWGEDGSCCGRQDVKRYLFSGLMKNELLHVVDLIPRFVLIHRR